MPLYEPTIPCRYVTPLIEILRQEDPGGVGVTLAAAGFLGGETGPADSSLPMVRFDRLPYTRFHFSSEALPEVRCVIPAALVRRQLPRRPDASVRGAGHVHSGSPSGLQMADRYGEWVGLMLREAQTVQPSVQQLAALLNMSPRTLARRLAAEGINFRELSTHIRHQRACAMLADPSIALEQISYQLGCSDTTAFIRGFRQVSGTTPALYRERPEVN